MPTEIARGVLQKRYEDISVNFRTTWDLYLKFYTVFLTFNIAALVWFSTTLGSNSLTPQAKWVIAIAFVMQCAFAAGTSAKLGLYSRRIPLQLAEVAADLKALAAASGETLEQQACMTTSLPLDIGAYGGLVNTISMIALGTIWLVLAVLGG